MADKIIDCIYCKGRGWYYTDLMYQKDCKECNGTGTKVIKEVRKSILVELSLHRRLTELSKDYRADGLVPFLRQIADYLETNDIELD